jgi:hypothetical protein
MDDFWAVIWGASIALVASVIGGFMTSVIGPWVARRADAKAAKLAAADARRDVLRQAIWDASIALRAYAVAPQNDLARIIETMDEVELHMVKIRLWTTHEERAVADCLMRVLAVTDRSVVIAISPAWEEVAARWFRRDVNNESFTAEFERVGEERLSWKKTPGSETPSSPEQQSEGLN